MQLAREHIEYSHAGENLGGTQLFFHDNGL